MEENIEKENSKIARNRIIENMIIAAVIAIYFILINVAYFKLGEIIISNIIKIISLVFLFLSIIIFEIAYHKDSGKLAINGIEVLVLAIHELTIWQEIKKFDISFDKFILFSGCIFVIYYIIKSILIFTKERRKYLKSLSDIHEIVKEEPVKKEAKKRKHKETTEK